MSLITTTPQTGDRFGPGFVVEVTSDLVGPLEPGSFWTFTLTAPANENIVAAFTWPADDHDIFQVMKSGSPTSTFIWPALPESVDGVAGQLRIELTEPTSGVIDSLDTSVVIDRVSGQSAELFQAIYDNRVPAGTGLTEDEHNAVLQTNVGVIAMAGINPIDLVGDLAHAFSVNPPLGFGSLSAVYELIGDGEMPDVGDLLHVKLGIYFVASSIPIGFSHRHGQSEEYPIRLLQWRTVHSVGGLDMVTEVVDFVTHGELWKWSQAKPSRIEYSVTPGVVIHAQWWQFP